jgi:sugar porter (SP) family MFS transporter
VTRSTSIIAAARRNPLLARAAAIAALGGFLFGYDTGVISGALLFIHDDLHAGHLAQQSIVGSLLLGAIAGAGLSGWTADRFSRRWTKFGSGCVYVVGALGSAFSSSVPELVGFRFLLGIAVGTASFVGPLYISELAPPKTRGGLVSFNQVAITTGILSAYLVDYAFSGVAGNWRWMLGIGALPGAALAVGMLTVPHTPRWLASAGRDDQAREVLEKLRRSTRPGVDVDAELDGILRESKRVQRSTWHDLLSPRVRPMLVVGLGLAIFQQIVGINTVIYYAPTILKATGVGNGGAIAQTVAIGVTNVVFTIVAVALLDRVGRRVLLLSGTVGLVVALAVLAAYFTFPSLQHSVPALALIALVVYIAAFAIGLGPVFWLMISEIYPLGVRGVAMSVSSVTNWGFNFLVSFTFLTLTSAITRGGTFLLYALIGVGAVVFFAAKVPETKGRSLEEITGRHRDDDRHPDGPAQQTAASRV